MEQVPGGEGVAKRVWATRLDAGCLERGLPVAVAPVSEVEVAASWRGEYEARVRGSAAVGAVGGQRGGGEGMVPQVFLDAYLVRVATGTGSPWEF